MGVYAIQALHAATSENSRPLYKPHYGLARFFSMASSQPTLRRTALGSKRTIEGSTSDNEDGNGSTSAKKLRVLPPSNSPADIVNQPERRGVTSVHNANIYGGSFSGVQGNINYYDNSTHIHNIIGMFHFF